MPGFSSHDYIHAVVLAGTAAITCKAGVLGTAGAVRDTEFFGAYIIKNAGPATLTITGHADNTGAAQSWVITGSTTVDLQLILPWPMLNEFAAFTFQPSVTLTCWIFLRAYSGP